MSLRDQLLAKGLVSKKDARRVDQELREARKQTQAHKRPASEVAREEVARRKAQEAAALQRAVAARAAREARREAVERRLRIRQIIARNAVRSRGKVRFHHRTVDGQSITRIEISDAVAWKLRCGEAAIVALVDEPDREGGDTTTSYVIVSARAAQRLEEIQPGIAVHFVRDTAGLAAPEEAFLLPDWPISLIPHRVQG